MLKSALLIVLTLALSQAAPHHHKHKHATNSSLIAFADVSGFIKNKTNGMESMVNGTVEFIQDVSI